MRYLRTNTATRVTVGPFFDKTDGITSEVALTVTNEKLTFMVDTGGVPTLVLDVAPTASGGNNDMVHVTNDDAGFYDLELTAANVNYLGRAMLALTDAANHCPVFHEFMIVPAVVYDAMFLGTDNLDVSVADLAADSITAAAIATDAIGAAELAAGAVTEIQSGLATSAALTTHDGKLDTVDGIVDNILVDTGTTLDGKLDTIDGNVDSVLVDTGTTLDGKLDTIDTNVDAVLVDTGTTIPATITTIDDELAVVDGIVDDILVDTGTTLDGKIDTIDTNVDAILVDTGTTLDGKINTIDTNVDAILVDTGTTLDGLVTTVDTVVDAIKAKTDNLPGDPADESDIQAAIAVIDGIVDNILVDTGTTLDGKINTIDANVDAILVDTGTSIPAILTAIKGAGWTTETLVTIEAAIASAGGGSGAISWTYNLKDNLGVNIADATIWVTSDIGGTTVLASGLTDANGDVTFDLDAGTVYVWGQKSGYNFSNPDTEVVA